MRAAWRLRGTAFGALLPVAAAMVVSSAPAAGASAPAAGASVSGCRLGAGGDVKHVIYLVFDNVHLTRDNPAVPSDLEQMPNLLGLLSGQGTMSGNNHTPLIAHTATDILTGLTGVYGDRHGVPVSNSYRYFLPSGASNGGSSFAYWTDPVFDTTTSTSAATDPSPNMLAADGKNAPAPWVPYTRAGCDVGAVASANTVVENVTADIPTVFGTSSPEYQQLVADPDRFKDPEVADYEGIAVHCARGSAVCSTANHGVADALPDEPGGYAGYQGLFGHKYVAPRLTADGTEKLTDLNGTEIDNPFTHGPGFPGFDGMSAAVSLSYVAAMQEHGVPVTYAYLSDLHDNHNGGGAYGPGQAGYEAALRAEDQSFGTFFGRLAADGITTRNTLFVVTADENDHFAGATVPGCDGVTTPCTYGPGQVGELNTNVTGLLATQRADTTPFGVHADSAPNFYLTGNPARTDPTARTFERDLAGLTADNPYSGVSGEKVVNFLADPVEEKLLHMVTADPARIPTVTAFAKPDYFLFSGAPNCGSPCVAVNPAFAWNHGDVSPDINRTWLGLAGPGVRTQGITNRVWSDHTDIRPTMLALLGLRDDYRSDGRVLTEFLTGRAVPPALRRGDGLVEALGAVYKQLNACVGTFGLTTLAASTRALTSADAGDGTYSRLEAELTRLGARRDAVAGQIATVLSDAAFAGRPISSGTALALLVRAELIIREATLLAR